MVATRARSRKQQGGEGEEDCAASKATTTAPAAASGTKANGNRRHGSGSSSSSRRGGSDGNDGTGPLNPLSFRLWNWALVLALLAWPAGLLARLRPDAFRWEHGVSNNVQRYLGEQALLALASFVLVMKMVQVMGDYCRRKGQTGRDLCKRGTAAGEVDIPESQGLAPGIIYMVAIIVCQLMYSQTPESLANYNSSLLSICFMLFLGFVDDVLDLPWRYKLILPPIATMPLLCSYNGSTSVIVPKPLRGWVWRASYPSGPTALGKLLGYLVTVDSQAKGKIIELGWLFMLYMALLAVFCTNAINIYAGINGLEAGQSLVMAVGVLLFKLGEIHWEMDGIAGPNQVLALTLVLPFIACTLGLLSHNFYPAKAFVGDTYCYFAGMTFAVLGIHGHFSKTLVFLFLPQVLNFLFSLPQLFKLVPCPRHRLPRFDARLGKLLPSVCPCAPHEHRWIKRLQGLDPDSDHFINLTLINAVLRLLGPTHERTLCLVLLALQALVVWLVMYVRFQLTYLFA